MLALLVSCSTATMMAQFTKNRNHGSAPKEKKSSSTQSKPAAKPQSKPQSKPSQSGRGKQQSQQQQLNTGNSGNSQQMLDIISDRKDDMIEKPVDHSYVAANGAEELNLSKPWSGGTEWISVATSFASGFQILDKPSWVVVSGLSQSGFNLECAPNSSSAPRRGVIEIVAEYRKCHIVITQDGNSTGQEIADYERSAIINRVWFDKNIKENNEKKLLVHLDFNVNQLPGERFRVYLYFFRDDNVTRLADNAGTEIQYFAYGKADYTFAHWDDFKIYVPNNLFLKAHNFKKQCTIDIEVTDDNGKRLLYKRNCITVGK